MGVLETTAREVTHRRLWNEAVTQLPYGHILQSFEWGEFKGKYGWTPTRLLFEEDSQVRAAASVLCRQLPHFPLRVMYVPKGPLLDYGDGQLLGYVLASLEELARAQRAIFIKMDPDVRLEKDQVIGTLRARGWRSSSEQIQFRNTILIDLRHSEDELLASMKAKTRYNIRLAARRGVKVRVGGPDDLPLFHEMYAETGRRDDFIIRPFAYYQDAWGAFIEAGLACLFLAEYAGEPLAGLIAFRFGQRAWYMYGASVRSLEGKAPQSDAQSPLAVGGHSLGQRRGLHHLRHVGRSRRAERGRSAVGGLPVQGGLWRTVCASHRRLRLSCVAALLLVLHCAHAPLPRSPAGQTQAAGVLKHEGHEKFVKFAYSCYW